MLFAALSSLTAMIAAVALVWSSPEAHVVATTDPQCICIPVFVGPQGVDGLDDSNVMATVAVAASYFGDCDPPHSQTGCAQRPRTPCRWKVSASITNSSGQVVKVVLAPGVDFLVQPGGSYISPSDPATPNVPGLISYELECGAPTTYWQLVNASGQVFRSWSITCGPCVPF